MALAITWRTFCMKTFAESGNCRSYVAQTRKYMLLVGRPMGVSVIVMSKSAEATERTRSPNNFKIVGSKGAAKAARLSPFPSWGASSQEVLPFPAHPYAKSMKGYL